MAESRGIPTPTSTVVDLPARAETAHKAQVGKVALYAGSRGMSGAAVLCGLGALRGGAGLVRIYTPESVQPIVAASEPCFMVHPLSGRESSVASHDLVNSMEWASVHAAGPGIGTDDYPLELVQTILQLSEVPLVLDADALNVLAAAELTGRNAAGKKRRRTSGSQRAAQAPPWWSFRSEKPTVITPHPGEMSRLRRSEGLDDLRGDDDQTRLRIAHEYAVLSGVTVVLKGHRTVVCTPDQAYINTTGNPGMATGGMGDVLTGLIAALLGQGLGAFDAARLGVHVHGLAADEAARRIGPVGYTARDVADLLPAALSQAISTPIGFNQP